MTVSWYKDYYFGGGDTEQLTLQQIHSVILQKSRVRMVPVSLDQIRVSASNEIRWGGSVLHGLRVTDKII